MLCQECKEKKATVHLTKIVNGKKEEYFLCEDCARAKGEWGFLTEPVSLHSFLSGLLSSFESQVQPKSSLAVSLQCEGCGLSFEDFKKTGRFGCSNCYDTFSVQLTPLLQRIHGQAVHRGKVPRRTGGLIRKRKEVEDLRRQMDEAVRTEHFEEAARFRDEIRSLEQELEGDKDGS